MFNIKTLGLAALVAAGPLTLAPEARAFDRGDCNWLFGAANVSGSSTFRINAGEVDFGDHLHFAGSPAGSAVVCWAIDGRAAVVGRVFADSIRENVMAIADVTFFRGTRATNPSVHSVFGNFAANSYVAVVTAPGAQVTRVRVRLFNGNVSALGDAPDRLLRTVTFRR